MALDWTNKKAVCKHATDDGDNLTQSLSPSSPAAVSVPYADLISALDSVNAQPLWDRYGRVTRREPVAKDTPMCWAWADMAPLIDRATREVSMEDAERRVLLLTHPVFKESFATTTNLSAGLQTLLPGEVARAHRHTLQAIRFVMEGSGAVTSVNNQANQMQQGDFILTPAWTWHEHVHPGTERVVWFDGLDLPLCRDIDTMFFELGAEGKDVFDPPATRAPSLHANATVLKPDSFDAHGDSPSRFRYAKERAWHALDAATPDADGSRWLRYVNGESMGAVMPTLDCYLVACAPHKTTRPRRSTSNAVCVVAQGQGSSQVGNKKFDWQRNDVFTVPHWNWVSHTASDDAIIFMMTDRELLASLGYLREEISK